MRPIALKEFCDRHGLAKTSQFVEQAVKEKKLDVYKVRLPELVEAFLGRDYYRAEQKLKHLKNNALHLLEAGEANDASAFSNITGQLMVTIVKDKYQHAEYIGDQLFRTMPNPGGNLKEHLVPYLSDIDSDARPLTQMEPYPMGNFREQWVTLPPPQKWGQAAGVSFEMAFSDLTGQWQESVGSVGKVLGYNREVRMLRVALGIVNSYVFNNVAMNTYLSTENATGKYVNRIAAQTIVNHRQINSVEQLFYRMRDPATNRRILARPTAVLCMPEKRYDLKRIINATTVRAGDITTGQGDQTESQNPLDTRYPILTSSIAQQILDDETSLTANEIEQYVIFGDFQKAFMYREVYPFRVEYAPAGNPMEFHQDIIVAVKAGEFGVPAVYDPRHAALSTAEAS